MYCRLFQAIEGYYVCKWHSPVDSFEIMEPDYHKDNWDHFIETGEYTKGYLQRFP